MDRLHLMRKAHALAQKIFGQEQIDGMPAYAYFMKNIIAVKFGKKSRSQLTDDEWGALCHILEELHRIKRGLTHEKGIENDDEPTCNGEDAQDRS